MPLVPKSISPRSTLDIMIAPPDRFEGPISEYVERFVVPNLASPTSLGRWIQAVVDYYETTDPICIVRGPRKGELVKTAGVRVVHSDNSPGIWCFVRALDGGFDPSGLERAMEDGRIPVLAALKGRDKRDWEWNYARNALSRRDSGLLWNVQLKHCHILPVKKTPSIGPREQAVRNICPANHFAFPNGWGKRHFITERIGWSEPAPNDLGESPLVIGWVRARIEEHLGPEHARCYKRFLHAAGSGPLSERLADRRIRIERVQRKPEPRRSLEHQPSSRHKPAPASKPLGNGIGAKARRWTLNAKHGYYVKTGETAQLVELHLSFKDERGGVSPVGQFLLDLPDLVDKGVVTERDGVYDIKVVCRGGRFYLGVRSSPQVPLHDYSSD